MLLSALLPCLGGTGIAPRVLPVLPLLGTAVSGALGAPAWHAIRGCATNNQHSLSEAGEGPIGLYCPTGIHDSSVKSVYDAPPAATPAQHGLQRRWQWVDPSDIPAVKGRIHSTESFSAVDGPGVRYLVFLQGCAMRCMFCANPDTWDFKGGREVTSKQIIDKVKKVLPYLLNGGGITCSGGEPMLQPEFVKALFQEAHALGLNTCIDTTGQGTKHHHWDTVLPHTDLVLWCIKHIDPAKYQTLSGLPQKGAMAFAKQLEERGVPFWLRYVYVPGFTDDPRDVERLIEFCHKQPTLRGVELLPYHMLGRNKWEILGLKYPLDGVQTPSRQQVQAALCTFRQAGINVICSE